LPDGLRAAIARIAISVDWPAGYTDGPLRPACVFSHSTEACLATSPEEQTRAAYSGPRVGSLLPVGGVIGPALLQLEGRVAQIRTSRLAHGCKTFQALPDVRGVTEVAAPERLFEAA